MDNTSKSIDEVLTGEWSKEVNEMTKQILDIFLKSSFNANNMNTSYSPSTATPSRQCKMIHFVAPYIVPFYSLLILLNVLEQTH